MRRTALISLLTLLMATGLGRGVEAESIQPVQLSFGVLGSKCSPERLAALKEAGVSVVELPLAWDRYEPAAGRVDSRYVLKVRKQLDACRAAGIQAILSPGLHYAPAWVKRLSGGTLRGSAGGSPKHQGAELIFSAAVRDAAHNYLERVVSDLGLDGITAIRVGTSGTGELGYPGPEDGGNAREFWAFGDAPQLGKGLAEGAARSPMPGWRPGSRSWHGKAVTADQVQAWWDWYSRSVVDALVWQATELRNLGFEGRIHVPVAGSGVLPVDQDEAVRGRLDGRANPDGAQERGLDYKAQFAVLSTIPGVDIDFTGLDDVSDVRARARQPRQDRCLPDDENNVLREDTRSWSSHRYTSALARRAGLGLVGENPGPPDSPFTGGSVLSDGLADQLWRAPGYAAECGMSMFLFGFEHHLFEDDSGVNLGDYEAVIQELRARLATVTRLRPEALAE